MHAALEVLDTTARESNRDNESVAERAFMGEEKERQGGKGLDG